MRRNRNYIHYHFMEEALQIQIFLGYLKTSPKWDVCLDNNSTDIKHITNMHKHEMYTQQCAPKIEMKTVAGMLGISVEMC